MVGNLTSTRIPCQALSCLKLFSVKASLRPPTYYIRTSIPKVVVHRKAQGTSFLPFQWFTLYSFCFSCQLPESLSSQALPRSRWVRSPSLQPVYLVDASHSTAFVSFVKPRYFLALTFASSTPFTGHPRIGCAVNHWSMSHYILSRAGPFH